MQSEHTSIIIGRISTFLRPSYANKTKTNLDAEIARRLSCIAAKTPPWTWRYVQGIQSGTIAASPRIAQAARFLLARLTGADPAPVPFQSETVQVHAPAGTITPGAWILGKSRTCADPICTIHFVPRVPWQKYCPLHTRR